MPRLGHDQRTEVRMTLNGDEVRGEATPRLLLSDFLRQVIGATGTRVGCEHGVCGACTVHLNGRVARSCLTLVVQADGTRVDTIEGQAESDGSLDVIQRAFKRNFALQCGFCTPGIVMSLADYLSRHDEVTEPEIRELIGGHLCRCTGYSTIVKAALEAAQKLYEFRRRDAETAKGGARHAG